MTVGFKQLREARSGFAFRVYMSFIPVVLLPLILASAVFYVTYRNAVSGVVKKYSYNIVANLSVNIDDQLVALTQSCNDLHILPMYSGWSWMKNFTPMKMRQSLPWKTWT